MPVLAVEFSLEAPNFDARADVAEEVEEERRDEELTVRGEVTGGTGTNPGEGVRPSTGGVRMGEDVPDGGLGVDGLLQDVKKSSASGPSAGAVCDSMPSTIIPLGNLFHRQFRRERSRNVRD